MCWQCDKPGKTTGDYLRELRSTIRQHGWAVQFVEHERAPYAYTIGLHRRGFPELVITGLAPKRSAQFLNCTTLHAICYGMPATGVQLSLGQLRAEVVRVEHPDAHMDMAIAIAGGNLEARQLVCADAPGRWPWQRGFDRGMRRQPVLGVRGP
jgi:Domain of unknown function (DUF4262)